MALSVDVALEDLNVKILDLRVCGFDDRRSKEQGQGGVTFTQASVEDGGSQAQDFSDSCQAIVDQIRSLEEALATAGRDGARVQGTGGSAGIVKSAVVRGMPSPPPMACGTAAVRSV